MVCENDKSYRPEILIVYAWNKFFLCTLHYFFSTGITFLIFLKSICVFQILREIPHFESARQKNKTSDMHENLIDYTQDILIHIYDINFVSNFFIF